MLHAACSVQNNVKDVEDIKTSHNRFLSDFIFDIRLYFIIVRDVEDVYELQWRF